LSTVGGHAVASGECALPNATPNSTPKDKPFPFLALPKDLRLMVYERLPFRISERPYDHVIARVPYEVIFVVSCTSVGILATCRQIHDEAAGIMGKKLAAILSRPLYITVDISLFTHLHGANSPFMGVTRCMEALQERVLRDARPDTWYENDDVLEAATIGFTDYCRKWFPCLKKKYLASRTSIDPMPSPFAEVGISYDQDDLYAYDNECLFFLWRFATVISADHTIANKGYVQFTHRLIQEDFPVVVLQRLTRLFPPGGDSPGLRFGDSIPHHIDSMEYASEWRASDGLRFPPTKKT
jgi:hypothetical protein